MPKVLLNWCKFLYKNKENNLFLFCFLSPYFAYFYIKIIKSNQLYWT